MRALVLLFLAVFGLNVIPAFTPLLSNYVFIAYGLTTMSLRMIALPFFIGRSVSYSFSWIYCVRCGTQNHP